MLLRVKEYWTSCIQIAKIILGNNEDLENIFIE